MDECIKFLLMIIFFIKLLIYHLKDSKSTFKRYKNKRVLIIGGTSGLGLAIANLLHNHEAVVTIASRKRGELHKQFEHLVIDVIDLTTFPKLDYSFDFIFCCAGQAKPGFFRTLTPLDYELQMRLNYMGTINALHHFSKYNKNPFSFVIIASTVVFFTFPGYSAYSPTKSALKSFFDSVFYEMKADGINLYIYYVNSMSTAGLCTENQIKPNVTKIIEGECDLSAEYAAIKLINGISSGNEICSDFYTKVFKHRLEFNGVMDIFFCILSAFIYPLGLLYIKLNIFRGMNN